MPRPADEQQCSPHDLLRSELGGCHLLQMLCPVRDAPYPTEVFTDLLKALCERAGGVNRYDSLCGIPKAKIAAQLRLMGVPHPIMKMKQGYGGVEGGAKISTICEGSLIVGLNHSCPEFGRRPKFPD